MVHEFKHKRARLQMSLFSTLYKKSGGYLVVPSVVFKKFQERTEWGKLDNFKQAIDVIFDIYYYEANTTLRSTRFLGGDSMRADRRFGTDNAIANESMIRSYKDFVMRVGDKLGFKFNKNFEYFEELGTERKKEEVSKL